jgi:hypothetical protein
MCSDYELLMLVRACVCGAWASFSELVLCLGRAWREGARLRVSQPDAASSLVFPSCE